MTEPMSEERLEEIRERHMAYVEDGNEGMEFRLLEYDIPALLAEVNRLRRTASPEGVEDLEREIAYMEDVACLRHRKADDSECGDRYVHREVAKALESHARRLRTARSGSTDGEET